jgi:hypothetical protein
MGFNFDKRNYYSWGVNIDYLYNSSITVINMGFNFDKRNYYSWGVNIDYLYNVHVSFPDVFAEP